MCDTLIALKSSTVTNIAVFGKNSDRPPNEAQHLAYFPAGEYSAGTGVSCTYIDIPQNKTYAADRDKMEKQFFDTAFNLHNDKSSASRRGEFSKECLALSIAAEMEWNNRVEKIPVKRSLFYGGAWRGFNKKAGLKIP